MLNYLFCLFSFYAEVLHVFLLIHEAQVCKPASLSLDRGPDGNTMGSAASPVLGVEIQHHGQQPTSSPEGKQEVECWDF